MYSFFLTKVSNRIFFLVQNVYIFAFNYESFGIAQIESASMDMLVPVLGYWPLWNAYDSKLNSMIYPLNVVLNELKNAVNDPVCFKYHLARQSTFLNNLGINDLTSTYFCNYTLSSKFRIF